MAVFHVLPPRRLVGQRFGELLASLFPSRPIAPDAWSDLAESLASLVASHDRHIVFRDDLDDTLSVKDALLRDFGAALDDEIIETHFGPGLFQFLHQNWSTERHLQAA